MRIGRTAFLHFTTQVVVSIAGFISSFAIGFLLGESVLGQYSIAVALGFYWLVIPGTAIAQAINKRVSEGISPSAFLTAGYAINTVVALLTGVLILGLGTAVGAFFPESSAPFVRVLSGSKELVAGLAVAAVLFQTSIEGLGGQKKVAEVGVIKAIERVLRTSGQVAFILLGLGLMGLLVGQIASLLLAGFFAVFLYEIGFKRPTKQEVRELLTFSQYGWASSFQARAFGWLDVLILSLFVSDGLIGIYEAAWGFGSLLATLSSSIQAALFPEISELAVKDQYDEIRHILGEGVVFAGLFVIPGFFGAAIIGERLLEIYRPSFGKGAPILVLLIVAYVADVYGSQFINALNAIDRPDATYRVNLIFVVSSIGLNFLLIWQYGWVGAAVATALSSWLRTVLAYLTITKSLGSPYIPFQHIGWEILAAIVMAAVVAFVNQFVPETRLFTVLLVLLGATVYTGLVVLLSTLIRRKARNVADLASFSR